MKPFIYHEDGEMRILASNGIQCICIRTVRIYVDGFNVPQGRHTLFAGSLVLLSSVMRSA